MYVTVCMNLCVCVSIFALYVCVSVYASLLGVHLSEYVCISPLSPPLSLSHTHRTPHNRRSNLARLPAVSIIQNDEIVSVVTVLVSALIISVYDYYLIFLFIRCCGLSAVVF